MTGICIAVLTKNTTPSADCSFVKALAITSLHWRRKAIWVLTLLTVVTSLGLRVARRVMFTIIGFQNWRYWDVHLLSAARTCVLLLDLSFAGIFWDVESNLSRDIAISNSNFDFADSVFSLPPSYPQHSKGVPETIPVSHAFRILKTDER